MTVLVRLLLFVLIATIGVSLLAWVITRQPRYLAFAKLTAKCAVIALLAVALLLILERLLIFA
jgi:hypothetical protein